MMKLVKKFKNGIFSIALFLGAVYACSDDFVDILPEYSLGSESFFNNESDYYEGLSMQNSVSNSTEIGLHSKLAIC